MSMRSISTRRRARLLRHSALAATMLILPVTAHAQTDPGEDQPESTEIEAPAAAIPSAMPRPMPPLPPVTAATRPLKSNKDMRETPEIDPNRIIGSCAMEE